MGKLGIKLNSTYPWRHRQRWFRVRHDSMTRWLFYTKITYWTSRSKNLNKPETLLTGCVPNLQLNCFTIKFNCSDFEVNANSWNVAFWRKIEFSKTDKLFVLPEYVSSENRNKRHDFPTPESPIRSSLNK